MQVVLLTENATLPTQGTPGSIGYDLYATDDYCVFQGSCRLIPLDIAIKLPRGTYGRIAPRSSLALKMIDVGGGVIDPDYRGNVKIILINNGSGAFNVRKGDRIAQLILEEARLVPILQVDSLDETDRVGGFGSTDKFY